MTELEKAQQLIKELEASGSNATGDTPPSVKKYKLDMCKVVLIEPNNTTFRYITAADEQTLLDNMFLIKEYCANYATWRATSIVDRLQHNGCTLEMGVFDAFDNYRTIDTIRM